MPVYEYTNLETGKIELHLRSVAERDSVPGHLQRIQIPSRISVCLAHPPSQSEAVLRGFYKAEEKLGTTALMRESGFTPREIKEIWTDGYHPEEKQGYDPKRQEATEQQNQSAEVVV